MKPAVPFLIPGSFTLGCNYWASHAGTRMWTDWNEAVVEQDLKTLRASGLTVLRIFPLWSDFQPIVTLRTFDSVIREIRMVEHGSSEEIPLPPTVLGLAGVSEVMVARFARFCELAERHDIKLIIGLITGWMSGRLYAPAALTGRNMITDPMVQQWQVRFVRTLVERFRDTPAISCWDLGNECNCMCKVETREQAYAWTALITGTIRSADASRPVISGMHVLAPGNEFTANWTMQDQGEFTDILTTHPYPYWIRHANQDAVDTVRTTLHATAETRFYGDLGGKPCMAEEIGTMGPMLGDWSAAANFVRTNLFSLWANDCRCFLWWCAFDQTRLAHAPYDWVAVELELGLVREDGSAKPMLAELAAFAALREKLPLRELPARRIDAICVLTRGQDQWGVAYSAWVLAAQAKLSLRFAWADAPLPDAALYILPSINSHESINRRYWLALLEKVKAGADLFVTLDQSGILSPFTEVFGVEVASRAHRRGPSSFSIDGQTLTITKGVEQRLRPVAGTTVLAGTAEQPVITSAPYGKGRAMLCTFPVEMQLTSTVGALDPGGEPFHAVYRLISQRFSRPVDCDDANVAITYHGSRHVVLVNHGDKPATPCLAPGVSIARWLTGGPQVAAHDGAIIELANDF